MSSKKTALFKIFTMISLRKSVNCEVLAYLNCSRGFSSKLKIVKDLEYQYLQRSKVPTMHFQKSLPRLPVPDISNSGDRYLRAIKPLLTADQYKQAEQRTMKFINQEGKQLQEKLIIKDKANKHTSYISEYWFELYLRDRAALPINYNPLIVFQYDTKLGYNNQIVRATNLLISAVRFMNSLRENILEPEIFHLKPKKSNTPLFRKVTGFLPESLSWFVYCEYLIYKISILHH